MANRKNPAKHLKKIVNACLEPETVEMIEAMRDAAIKETGYNISKSNVLRRIIRVGLDTMRKNGDIPPSFRPKSSDEKAGLSSIHPSRGCTKTSTHTVSYSDFNNLKHAA